jgi:hypothetical protein
VPSAAHYILQAHARHNGYEASLNRRRALPDDVEAPAFRLGGAAIGNGFTDAVSQTMVQAEVAWSMGLIDTTQRKHAEAMQDEVVELVRNKQWRKARKLSDALLGYITNCSASGTLEDVRRCGFCLFVSFLEGRGGAGGTAPRTPHCPSTTTGNALVFAHNTHNSDKGYDAEEATTGFLNLPHIKQRLGVPANVEWVSCSPEVR